jgi:ribonuclease BN (tRNA processing enzyme)
MKLTILGSGTMMPTKNRYPAASLIEDDATKMLLDCGHMTIPRLLERDIDLHSITHVCITHFHADHFSHLLPLVQARSVDDMVRQQDHRPLVVYGPQTLVERFGKLREVMWPEPKENYAVSFVEGKGEYSVGKLKLTVFPVQHVPWFPSVGYRITGGGRNLVYTGDLNNQQAARFEDDVRGADLLLIEAAAEKQSKTHFMAEEAVALARKCAIKRVLLTHIRDDYLARVQLVIDKHPDILTLAKDGMRVEV